MTATAPPRREPARASEPFADAEQAWFWTMAALRARHEGASRRSGTAQPRPCDPDDVIRCLDQLYRRRRIDLAHGVALRVWGERQVPPRAGHRDAALWHEAMDRLGGALRSKGIVSMKSKFSLTREVISA